MSQQELLTRVVGVLDSFGIPAMLTGSLVSSLQGEPRSTHDIDLIVAIEKKQADLLVAAFPMPEFYLSHSAILHAIQHLKMFNLLELQTGDKVDFWLLTNSPFDQSRFSRRRPVAIGGTQIDISSPEDTILAKLKWSKDSGGSSKQETDAARVFELQHPHLDLEYLQQWVSKLGLEAEWQRLLSSSDPLQ